MSSPRKFIIWPASIAFIISYPFLYALLSPALPDVHVLPSSVDVSPEVCVKQLYVSPPAFHSVLSDFVIEPLAPFLDLLQDQDDITHFNSPTNDIELPYLHSILSLSSPGREFISLDSLPLLDNTKSYKAQLNSLLYYSRVVENEIQTASGLLISFVYNSTEDEQRWNRAVASITPTTPSSLKTFSYMVSSKVASEPSSLFTIHFTFLPFCPAPLTILIIAYSLLAFYIAISREHINSVRSKLGLFVAFLVQSGLAMASSITIVSFFAPSFSANSLRHFLIIPYLVIVVGIENVFRLINAVAMTPPENHPSARLSVGITCLDRTVFIVLINSALLLLPCIPFLSISPQIKHICIFTALCLLIDFAMHVTYFTAILSVDLRRLELEDLITDSPSANQHSEVLLDKQLPKAVKLHYFHLKSFLFNSKFSASSVILVLSIIFLFIWSYTTDLSEQHNYSSGKIPFFLSPLLSSAPFAKYGIFKVYEPLVLEGKLTSDDLPILFRIGSSIQGSFYKFIRVISINILLEFLASIAFILSLTGVILKFLLPPVSEPTETPATTEVMQFFSKELTGYHTLDVLQVVSQGSTITTVSLDHKVFVWNVASAPGTRIARPIQIPSPPDFWPITKVVLNSSLNLVAIFSTRISAIKCYNYRTGTLIYHLQDRALFSAQPVETFFSGPQLIVVNRSGLLLSVSETGVITNFTIEFSSNTGTLSHARRLMTPRIPERVVCLSTDNDITIGTHIGKVWKFRKLQIQESPMQTNMHSLGIHDFSKYKPQPIPAPQAMLARRPMRPGKFGAMNAVNRPPIAKPEILKNPIVALVPVPAINMVLIATAVHGCLFDAQTGIIVRHFQLGHFKPKTLRVFHSNPTHCRFCGCVSVDTLSIAYSDLEDEGMVICHTLTIDNRAKNSICIRVERDPRETRCLGFEATTERQHWIGRVEGWDTTDMNMIMGVRKKETPQDLNNSSLNLSSTSPLTSSISWIKNRSLSSTSSSMSPRDRTRRGRFVSNNINPPQTNQFPLISTTWEGWAMSATGQVSYYDIPDHSEHVNPNDMQDHHHDHNNLRHKSSQHHMNIGMELDGVSRSRLLIRSIGPVTKYGAKSIAVAFGNIIKVLYFGKEESIPQEADHGLVYPPSPSPSISGSRKWRREVGY